MHQCHLGNNRASQEDQVAALEDVVIQQPVGANLTSLILLYNVHNHCSKSANMNFMVKMIRRG